jgi:hypothetical protein
VLSVSDFAEKDLATIREWVASIEQSLFSRPPIVLKDERAWVRTLEHSSREDNFGELVSDTGWRQIAP